MIDKRRCGRMLARRSLLALIGALSIGQWPLLAHAQRQKRASIWIITPFSLNSIRGLYFPSFIAGLAESGLVDGRYVNIEYAVGEGHFDRLPALTARLVEKRVAVIVIFHGSPVALAVKAAGPPIPVVFIVGGDPVALGLVDSLNHPGSNFTGVSIMSVQLAEKQLQLLDGLLPKGMPIAALGNRNSPIDRDPSTIELAADKLGRRVLQVLVSDEKEFEIALEIMSTNKAGGLVVSSDPLFEINRRPLIEAVSRHRLPAIYTQRSLAADGGLMSYGPDMLAAFRQLGIYAGRVVNGESPAELPVIQTTKFQLVINLKKAQQLGIALPPALLALADEVIED